jgi:hypothetical protein
MAEWLPVFINKIAYDAMQKSSALHAFVMTQPLWLSIVFGCPLRTI